MLSAERKARRQERRTRIRRRKGKDDVKHPVSLIQETFTCSFYRTRQPTKTTKPRVRLLFVFLFYGVIGNLMVSKVWLTTYSTMIPKQHKQEAGIVASSNNHIEQQQQQLKSTWSNTNSNSSSGVFVATKGADKGNKNKDTVKQYTQQYTQQQQPEILQLEEVLQNEDLHVVTAFHKISNNPKHDIRHYVEALSKTLDMFISKQPKLKVTYFHNIHLNLANDTSIEDPIGKMLFDTQNASSSNSSDNSNNIELIYRPADQLLFEEAQQLTKLCEMQPQTLMNYMSRNNRKKDKAVLHKNRMEQATSEVWAYVVCIWISKLSLVKEVIMRSQDPSNNSKSKFFAWIDAGLMTAKDGPPSIHMYFDNSTVFDNHHVYVRHSPMRFNNSKVVFRAGNIGGPGTDVTTY